MLVGSIVRKVQHYNTGFVRGTITFVDHSKQAQADEYYLRKQIKYFPLKTQLIVTYLKPQL